MGKRQRRGQALVEYVIALAFMALVAGIAWHLVRAAAKSAERAENLVSSEYP